MKANQIAEALDVIVSSVKVWLHRARKRLAAHLKPT
jgi:DNA-directed RNA polymerase specialized sigma24 family protein|tara:strand:+ start:2140 stop:2247 length:108 start_codon:yes stop_codon:yes gene_type:complete